MANIELCVNGNKTGVRIIKAETPLARVIGLMGKKKIDHGLLIPGCSSIHTFFMKAPIDVVFTGRQGEVVKVIAKLAPWKMVLPASAAIDTIELESGAALKLGIKVNDIISFATILSFALA